MLTGTRPLNNNNNNRVWVSMKQRTPWAKAIIGSMACWNVMSNDRVSMPTSHWTLKNSWRKHQLKSNKNSARCPIHPPRIHMPPGKRRPTFALSSNGLTSALSEILERKEILINHVIETSSQVKPLVLNFNLMEMRDMILSMQTMSVVTLAKRKRTFSLKVDTIISRLAFSSSLCRATPVNCERFLAYGLAREYLDHCDDNEYSWIRNHQMLSLLADGIKNHLHCGSIWNSKRKLR